MQEEELDNRVTDLFTETEPMPPSDVEENPLNPVHLTFFMIHRPTLRNWFIVTSCYTIFQNS